MYSTQPRRAIGADSIEYFVKGTDKEMVFAELAGCVLANHIGLPVPCARVCEYESELYAGTRRVSDLRYIQPFLARPDLVSNWTTVFEVIAIDIWLCNTDRNMGNIVGYSSGGVRDLMFVYIDFEKSVCLRRFPTVQSASVAPRALWPTELLGTALRLRKPMVPPSEVLSRIAQVQPEDCERLLVPVANALGGIEWLRDVIETLAARARKIKSLVEEVWSA